MDNTYLEYLYNEMMYFKSFDRDMYIHYRNKLRSPLNTIHKINTISNR